MAAIYSRHPLSCCLFYQFTIPEESILLETQSDTALADDNLAGMGYLGMGHSEIFSRSEYPDRSINYFTGGIACFDCRGNSFFQKISVGIGLIPAG